MKRVYLFGFCALLLANPLLAFRAHADLRLSPDFVVNRILEESRDAKNIELDAQAAYTDYYNTLGLYDIGLAGNVSYEDTRLRSLAGGGNLRDKTTVWSVAASKRVRTGTTVAVSFNRSLQDSAFRPTAAISTRAPSVVYDYAEVKLSQDILGNFFGIAERKNIRAAEQKLDAAALLRKEQQENLVLDALRLFWDTYVARESFNEAQAQRDKYEALVKEVQSKNRLGFSSPGDLPKARAEFGAQVRNVEQASFEYTKNLDQLFTAMRLEQEPREVSFEFREALPPLPTMVMPALDRMRPVEINQVTFESAELTRQAEEVSSNWPEVKAVAAMAASGLADRAGGGSFSDIRRGTYPRYSVGLEVNYKLFSDTYRGALNQARVSADRSYNELLRVKEDLRRQLSTAMEQVRFAHRAATSAVEELGEWEKAVKAQENSYKQGRLDFSQLIQDYNSYFRARLNRIRTLGDYHIALHNYAATVDELVK